MARKTPPSNTAMPAFLEPLEPRIAPATLITVGAPEPNATATPPDFTPIDPNSFNYNYAPPGKTNPFVAIAPDFYAVSLGKSTGQIDRIELYRDGFGPWITLLRGEAKAFFKDGRADGRPDGIVQANELTGISYSGSLSLDVVGSIYGDIVGNLGPNGNPTSSLVAGPKVSIADLQVVGTVFGKIVGAGALNNVTVTGGVVELAAGNPVSSPTYNFGNGPSGLDKYTPGARVPGGSINAAEIGRAEFITAGVGGAGAAGGSINGLKVFGDADGIVIAAGAGGSDARGGAGGSVSNVIIQGTAQTVVAPLIKISAGSGGDATGSVAGNGGAVSKIYVGYESIGGKLLPSPVPLSSAVEIRGGLGGSGVTGGKGGNVTDAFVVVSTPDIAGRDEVFIAGGNGGSGSSRDGAGGGVVGVMAQNLRFDNVAPASDKDSIFIRGGDAGLGAGEGAAGGSVSKATVLADGVKVVAGNGSDGTRVGGNGGGLNQLTIAFSDTERAQLIQLSAGNGGSASATGRAGVGGSVTNVDALLVDLLTATFGVTSRIEAGDGGSGGTAGAGGGLSKIRIFEPSTQPGAADIVFETGKGGDGTRAGGRGGAGLDLAFIGFATTPTILAGNGGGATAGVGGAGGALSKVALKSDATAAPAAVQAGNGGSGAGSTGRGGAGGALNEVSVQVSSNVKIKAGDGGAGSAQVGAGGSITRGAAITSFGSSEVLAGNAGVATGTASKRAAGGSMSLALAVAPGDVIMQAGNGSAGGAGGSITRSGWYAQSINADGTFAGAAAPTGAIKIQAGHGSALANFAGAGGSIRDVAGFSSTNPAKAVEIAAGDGNGSGAPASAKAAAGGAVNGVSIFGGLAKATIKAGDGGSATDGSGGAGGSLTNVSGGENVNLKAVAAGNGGSGSVRGGAGGSVSKLNVFGDIGERSGAFFGYDTMGGIFAGSGGAGGGSAGAAAGRVTDVTADAISSIVAGRPLANGTGTFALANLVDRIALRGLEAPTINPDGSFSNVSAPAQLQPPPSKPATVAFNVANLVGAVKDPHLPGANVFKANIPITSTEQAVNLATFRPVDGLIAALTLGSDRNFRPEAVLTVTDPKTPTTFVLLNYRNTYLPNS